MTADIIQQFTDAGQGHLFQYWDELSSDEQSSFLEQLSPFKDASTLVRSVKGALQLSENSLSTTRNVKPLPEQSHSSLIDEDPKNIQAWYEEGLKLINRGEVGVILTAGGQGTRLGSSSPKGCYDIGLPSHKSLFQIQAEKIIKIVELSNKKYGNNDGQIPWYIMTSSATRYETEQFFIKHDYFGLAKTDVIFFNQGTLPCFTTDGSKILMKSKSSICESPDGNGGLYRGLYNAGILDDFERRNIKHLHMYCVDNCLAKVADPVFIGWSSLNNAQLSTKVVRKRNASEKVGLIVLDADKNCPCVMEYSEIPIELSERQNEDGSLYLKAANIVNHYYQADLLKKEIVNWISSQKYLPFHIAKKKIPYFDGETNEVKQPEEPNGIKLEQFVFDVFPSIDLERFGCLEVDRHQEFSPLKNGPGSANDCPETAREDSLKLCTSWIKSNGGIIEAADGLVEVSSLTSYGGEGLENVRGKTFKNLSIL